MSSVSRREFAAQVGGTVTGAVAAGLGTTTLAADPMPPATEKPAPPIDPPATPPLVYEDHQLALLKELHPAPHLTEEMFEGIRGGLKHNRALAERIRKVPLAHDVPPAFQFPIPPD